jgi:glycosyltransferase involved in cell wall biosynthesis
LPTATSPTQAPSQASATGPEISDRPTILRRARRSLGRILREVALYPALMRPGRNKLRIAFLPSDARVQSSLLRAYLMADHLAARGWRGIVLPKHLTLAQRQRVLRWFRPDIVVVQQCRHPLNRVQYLADWPLVLDIDDADFLDEGLTADLEAMARRSAGIVCGSRFIQRWALPLNPRSVISWTGTPVSPADWPRHAARSPILSWAQSSPLGYPEEFAFVCNLLPAVAERAGGVRFRLYGWDGSVDHPVLTDLRQAGVEVELLPFMDYGAFIASLRDVAVGLSPVVPTGFSQGKSFGKILAYLDAGVPVICSDEVDHAQFFSSATGVVSNDPKVWVDAICDLMRDPDRRDQMAEAAHAAFVDQLSTAAAGERLRQFLGQVVPAAKMASPA